MLEIMRQMEFGKFYFGLSMVIVTQLAGLIGYLQFGQIWWVWSGLLLTLILVLWLGWLVKQNLTKPLRELSTVGTALARDCESLSTALSELARGNLTAQVTTQAQPVHLATSAEATSLVTAFNTTITSVQLAANQFNELSYEPLRRLCYVGPDYYLDGRVCGETLGQAVSGQGQVVLMMMSFELDALHLRSRGAESVLAEKYPGIDVVDVVDTTYDPEEAYIYTRAILKQYPHLRGIYITDGIVPFAVARAVNDAGLIGQVEIICHDVIDETMHYLREGVITATLSQDLFAQGHDSVIHLFNHLVTGWQPPQPRQLTPLQLVTRNNYKRYWQPEAGLIQTKDSYDRLAKPLQPSPRPLRIAVHNRGISGVDSQLHAGALAATAKLRSYNLNVDLVSGGTLRVKPIVESVIAQNYDGLVVLAANKKDVQHLNLAVKAGVAIATYNAEPFSLRGLIASLTERAELLLGFKQDLAGLGEQTPGTAGNFSGNGPYPQDSSDGESSQQREIVRQAIRFMGEHLEDAIGVAEVAQAVFLSPSYFCRLFTEQTGCNPRDFLMDLRLERAKEYLSNTDMSVMDVCVALDYSPSYFSRFFKNRVGCTPGQYAMKQRDP